MKKLSPVGLVVEGNSTNSAILRLPRLPEDVGPIKSTAPRVAKRISNFLRAGYAVPAYGDLFESPLILIRAPDDAVPRIVMELCSAELNFKSLSVVLCESWVFSAALDPLRQKGASIATTIPVPSTRRRWFISEGDSLATRQIRRLIEKSEGQSLELRSGRKENYFAAELLTTAIPIALFGAAQKALRDAGISGKYLQVLLAELAEKMFLDFLHASRTKWGGPLAECSPQVSEAYLNLLRGSDPELSGSVTDGLQFAAAHLQPKVRRQ